MRQRILAMSTNSRNEIVLAIFESQYLVGAASPCGHSISNVSCGRAAAPLIGAVRTRTRAKRERSGSAEPPRHVMVRQACFGRPSASSLALTRSSGNPNIRPDLSGADLSGANLRGANLNEANLIRANLNSAHLNGANLN